jgi:hypothetical protein
MSTYQHVGVPSAKAGRFAGLADRWIYVFMAMLFVVTTLVGFIPDSFELVADVRSGRRPPIPPVLHLHAVLMGIWLLLLLTQTTLVAMDRRRLHAKLGLAAFGLVPVMVCAMLGVIHELWAMFASMPPDALPPEVFARIRVRVSNTLLEQIRLIVLFPGLVACALVARRKDSETHKRMMVLASALLLPAAVDRMTWVPNTLPASPVSIWLSTFVLLLPALLYDVVRRGRVHRAYVVGLAANVPFCLASYLLWGSSWWLATAPRLVGAW